MSDTTDLFDLEHYFRSVSLWIEKNTVDDGAGRFYISGPETRRWLCYYDTIERLRPLFESPQFQRHISGYYVSSNGDFNAVRLVYLTPLDSREKAEREIETFIQKNKLSETDARRPPDPDSLAKQYGGSEFELQFRQFLALETLIGLEIMKANLLHAQSLLATYRFQVFIAHSCIRQHFEPTFQRDSDTFHSLSSEDKNSLWLDFSKSAWAHFLVNLVLGFDYTDYSYPNEPYSIPRINKEILEPLNVHFEIREDWKPQVV